MADTEQTSAFKTHPARTHLEQAGRRWPGLWAAFERVRAQYPSPAECYISDYYSAVALVESAARADLDILRGLTPLQVSRVVAPLTTLGCWRMTQGIYRIDPTLYESLIATPLTGELPADVLTRLPEWCIYVETPGLSVCRRDGGEFAELRGFFARIDCEQDGIRNLVLTLDMPRAEKLEAQWIALQGTLDVAIRKALNSWNAATDTTVAAVRHYVEPAINLLLYICSTTDISGKRGQPGNPVAKRTRRSGWRLFPAEGLRTWDVGVRMGAALRAAYASEETGSSSSIERSVRGHVRRAHWHGYRSGPRKHKDGTLIHVESRRFELKWLPPIPVNLETIDDLPATIWRV